MREKELLRKGIETISKLRKGSVERKEVIITSGHIDVENFKKAIYYLLEADEFLYKKAPKHYLNENEAKLFCKLLIKCKESLDRVLKNFGFEIEEKEVNENALYIVYSRKLFKKLKNKYPNLAVVCTESFLDINDFKGLVPENALNGLKKKVELAKKNIEKQIKNLKPKKIYVVIEDEKDEKLYLKAKDLYNAERIDVDDLL
ncbi:DUF2100 domain-containing protein [Methanocaldococcus villosus]|uniref:DUF2100 domain-containing protein n=1 Tax=Methanocaldococcus villosus TaxID=667126 RepID=UPI000371B815|nr:DUF2100 domain-containing protein [Methanocaldococcus villosus]